MQYKSIIIIFFFIVIELDIEIYEVKSIHKRKPYD